MNDMDLSKFSNQVSIETETGGMFLFPDAYLEIGTLFNGRKVLIVTDEHHFKVDEKGVPNYYSFSLESIVEIAVACNEDCMTHIRVEGGDLRVKDVEFLISFSQRE